MKQVRCLTCNEIIGIIDREFQNEPIEIYREYVVCSNEHNNKIIEDVEEHGQE